MSQAFLISRLLRSKNGTALTFPVRAVASEELMKESVAAIEESTKALRAGAIVVQTENGPRAVMSVEQFLAELGIDSLAVSVTQVKVDESNIVVPRKMVTLR